MSTALLYNAAQHLRAGRLVAFPTETVYGLGANALLDSAVAEIYAVKGRPEFNPLIIHVESAQAAQRYVEWNAQAEALACAFWPGPLTVVLPRLESGGVSLLASAGLSTLAVRVPGHGLALELLGLAQVPLAAPSANRSGRVSPTLAAHVIEELGENITMVLDGGPCAVGVESTVVDISGSVPTLLRPGGVTRAQLELVLGCAVMDAGAGAQINAPGMLASHYAPALPVRLNALEALAGEAFLAFGPEAPAGAARNLSPRGELKEAAANLFAYLRALDDPRYRGIAVMPIPQDGLGAAINDRLRRAAAK